jgi:hypothetical protein
MSGSSVREAPIQRHGLLEPMSGLGSRGKRAGFPSAGISSIDPSAGKLESNNRPSFVCRGVLDAPRVRICREPECRAAQDVVL